MITSLIIMSVVFIIFVDMYIVRHLDIHAQSIL